MHKSVIMERLWTGEKLRRIIPHYDMDGNLICFDAIVRDITEEKNMENRYGDVISGGSINKTPVCLQAPDLN